MGVAPKRLLLACAVAAALSVAAAPADAEPQTDESVADTIQFLADLTVIDGDCHELSVNFGIGFQFASAHGVATVAILPAGTMRPLFEHDLAETNQSFDTATICGALARHYATVVPGSVSFPYTLRDRNS